MTDETSELYRLHIIPAKIRKDSGEVAHQAVEVWAMQIGGDKALRASFSDMDEFMERLGPMLCFDAFRWRQIKTLLNQQDMVSIAGPDAELAFTAEELRDLGL
ncbi:MAG: hypothetical protein WBL50_07915 [Candidatus Acidiferrum sp.]